MSEARRPGQSPRHGGQLARGQPARYDRGQPPPLSAGAKADS